MGSWTRTARPIGQPYTWRREAALGKRGAVVDNDGAAVVSREEAVLEGEHVLRFWPLVAVSWLPLLASPIAALLREQPSPVRQIGAAIGLGCFVALYLGLVLRRPFSDPPLAGAEMRRRMLLLTALMAAGLALYPLLGTTMPLWYLVYAAIAAGIALPTRQAGYAVGAVAILASGASVVATGWLSALSLAVGLAAVGGSAIAVRRLVVTLAELRAAREELVRLAVAEERLRFARDLHDVLGHTLSLVALKSELARELFPSAPQRAVAEIRDVEEAARMALREVRAAVTGYRQPTLTEELAGAHELLASAGVAARFRHDAGMLPATVDATLAWAVREGVTNVIRHSGAHCCTILIARDSKAVTLAIVDDGRGDQIATSRGNGLVGLAERVATHGGELAVGNREGAGFRLQISLPLEEGMERAGR